MNGSWPLSKKDSCGPNVLVWQSAKWAVMCPDSMITITNPGGNASPRTLRGGSDGHHLLVDGSLRLQLDPVEIRMHGVRQRRPMAKDRLVEPSARTAEGGGGDDSQHSGQRPR